MWWIVDHDHKEYKKETCFHVLFLYVQIDIKCLNDILRQLKLDAILV